MKDGAKWYPRIPTKFLGGIQGLSAQEIAVYSVALDLIYQHGGRINNDPKWIAGWIADMGSSSVRKAIASLSDRGLLTIHENSIGNKTAEIYAKTEEKLRENRAESGAKGGKKSSVYRSFSRPKYNENNDLDEASASENVEAYKIREDIPSDTSYPQSYTPGSAETAKPSSAETAAAAARVPAPARDARVPAGAGARSPNDSALSIAVSIFNEIASAAGWPKVITARPMAEARKAKLRARIADAGGLKQWADQIKRAAESPFLRGENDQGWRAGFDFFLQSSNFTKLMEGNYDRKYRNPSRDGRREERHGGAAGGGDHPFGRGPAGNLLAGFARAAARGASGGDGDDGDQG